MSADRTPDPAGGWDTGRPTCAGYHVREVPCAKDDSCQCWDCQITRHRKGRDT